MSQRIQLNVTMGSGLLVLVDWYSDDFLILVEENYLERRLCGDAGNSVCSQTVTLGWQSADPQDHN